jgi:catechol 2,3-dioxygenase-like lactoylglutathione lyase family enzyme
MICFQTFSHVIVTVTDVEKARWFYGQVLGLSELERPDFGFPGIWYRLAGDVQLHIIANEQLTRSGTEREAFEIRYPHFALWTSDADRTADELAAAGVRVHDFVSTPTQLRQLFVKDPDGNMIEFIGPTRTGRGTTG